MKSLDCCSWASLVSPCLGSYMLCDFWWRHVFDRLACTGPGCHLFCWLWMPVKLLTAGIAKVFKQRIEMRWTCGQDLEEIKKTCSKKMAKCEAFQNWVSDHLLLCFLLQGSCIFKKGRVLGLARRTHLWHWSNQCPNLNEGIKNRCWIDVEKFRT